MKTDNCSVRKILKWGTLIFAMVMLLAAIVAQLLVSVNRLYFSTNTLSAVWFYDPPSAASNGEWAERAITEGHKTLRDSLEQLKNHSTHVVRAEIISERTEIIYYGKPGYQVPHVYSVYRLKILDVFMGEAKEGEYIEILQGKRRQHRFCPNAYENRDVNLIDADFIRLPLSVGDDLILFLQYHENAFFITVDEYWHFNTLQGLYYYTPAEIRAECENWVFESVNEYNNLVFTEADLLRLHKN
jgi:hypothetical protein